jgi:hypothetical protein
MLIGAPQPYTSLQSWPHKISIPIPSPSPAIFNVLPPAPTAPTPPVAVALVALALTLTLTLVLPVLEGELKLTLVGAPVAFAFVKSQPTGETELPFNAVTATQSNVHCALPAVELSCQQKAPVLTPIGGLSARLRGTYKIGGNGWKWEGDLLVVAVSWFRTSIDAPEDELIRQAGSFAVAGIGGGWAGYAVVVLAGLCGC